MKTTATIGAVVLALSGYAPDLAFAATGSMPDKAGRVGEIVISIDASASRHKISPLIYGASFADPKTVSDLRLPVDRSGGNSASNYNWRENARNAGRDWFYESLPCDPAIISDRFGSRFAVTARNAATIPMITIPYGGWVARLGFQNARLSSYSIAKYGKQKEADQWMPDAGNGESPDGSLLRNNDPFDAQMPDDLSSERQNVADIATILKGTPHYYLLDNEPSLWQLIHHDTHPVGAHASEIAAYTIKTANMIHQADPHGLVAGPEEWGWNGYRDSGYDQQTGTHADREKQTGGLDYVPWLLSQWKKAGHPVDVFSLHYYPQGGEFSDDVSPAIEQSRNVSTRDLWDRSYHNPTWINDSVALIPRMRDMVNTYYRPGTPIAITEYSWGAENSMNGATAQADILGIFGREGVDMATRWTAPKEGTPVYRAMKLYRNYDDHGHGFGSISVKDDVPDPDHISSFAAIRQDGDLTIVAINKDHGDAQIALSIKGYQPRSMEIYRLDKNVISEATNNVQVSDPAALHDTLPGQSVSLYILHR